MSRRYNNGVQGLECGICRSKNHCAELCDQNKAITKLHKVTSMKPAWTSVNMDLFGPYLIRDDCVKRGPRIYKKVWGVLFTCTLTRGVHLDVAMDYSTESVLQRSHRVPNLTPPLDDT